MSILGNNLLAQYYAQNQGLPFGYEVVEYLESTGTQWIDTGVETDWTNLYVMLDMLLFSHSANEVNYFGGDTQNSVLNYAGGFNSSQSFVFQITASFVRYGVQDENRHRHEFDNPNSRVGLDGVYTNWATWRNTNTNFTIFQRIHSVSVKNPSHNRLWKAVFSKNGIKIRNFIPCVRKSDGKSGLYDLCGSKCPLTNSPFYINAGTGEFVTP